MKLFVSIFFIFFSITALAQSSADEETIKAMDAALNKLIQTNNNGEAANYYAADFILNTSGGASKSKADILKEISSSELKLEINLTENVMVRVLDKTAVLTGILHQKGNYGGKIFDVFMKVTDTWVKTESGWKILAGHTSLIPKF